MGAEVGKRSVYSTTHYRYSGNCSYINMLYTQFNRIFVVSMVPIMFPLTTSGSNTVQIRSAQQRRVILFSTYGNMMLSLVNDKSAGEAIG
jgi:hypothetical protein